MEYTSAPAVQAQESKAADIQEQTMDVAVRSPRVGKISRARLQELFVLAYETVEWLESKGLKKGEQCEFREIAERFWWRE